MQAVSSVSVSLPGTPKFASFKNSLQEYCQKLKQEIPVYKTEKTPDGSFNSTVSFGTNFVAASTNHGTIKEAERQAAFDALKQLQLLPEDATNQTQAFTCAGIKRKSLPSADEATPTKQLPTTFKQRLNQMAQKGELTAPTFETVLVADVGFRTAVSFTDGKQFSGAIQSKKKNAEQSAAHMTLFSFGIVPEAPPGFNAETGQFDSPATLTLATALSVDNSVPLVKPVSTAKPFKNQLMEYCQKNKLPMPEYNINVMADQTGKCTVHFAGRVTEASVAAEVNVMETVNHGSHSKKLQKRGEEAVSRKAILAIEQEQAEKDNLVNR